MSTNTALKFYDNTFDESLLLNGTPDEELDGIQLLVSMAKSGEIDPWNIDIVDVADKYFVKMAENKSKNLRVTGRAILFLSILLKLKSNYLVGLNVEEPTEYNEFENFEEDYTADLNNTPVRKNNVVSLSEVLKRRTSIRLNRSRTVTLKDLIKQLKFYEELDRKQALQHSLDRAKSRAKSLANYTSKDIVKLAQDEYIDRSLNILKKNLNNIFKDSNKVKFENLLDLGLDKISAYMGLLFLTVESDVNLVQNEFYGDLYIERDSRDNSQAVMAV